MPRRHGIDEINKGALQVARERFKRRPGPAKSIFPFKWWVNVFSQRHNSFQEIAESVGCTRENIRRLYKKYFASLFPGFPNGRSRRRFYNLKQREQRLEEQAHRARDFSGAPETLREIAEIARRRGFTAEKIPIFSKEESVFFSSRSLLINGKRCNIHKVRHTWMMPRGKRVYTHINLSVNRLRKHDFLIALQEVKGYPRRVYIAPVSILLRRRGKRKKPISLCIPLKRCPVYHNHSPKLDFWQYLNAWHLLGNP